MDYDPHRMPTAAPSITPPSLATRAMSAVRGSGGADDIRHRSRWMIACNVTGA